jgi:hypothetical protein
MELMFEDCSWILSGAFPWFWAKVNKSKDAARAHAINDALGRTSNLTSLFTSPIALLPHRKIYDLTSLAGPQRPLPCGWRAKRIPGMLWGKFPADSWSNI